MEFHLLLLISFWLHDPGEPEIANLDVTIAIDQDISGFDIPMHNICGMNVIDSA
jgi:hypothetical protein